MIIGLTGGIASGKSTASRELARCGVSIIDADAISRTLLQKDGAAYAAVVKAFPEYVMADGEIDRRALGNHVFAHADALKALNAITHPIIVAEVKKRAEQEKNAVVDAPLLFEVGLDAICDEIWLITADTETRVRRIIARNGLSRDEALARIESQMPESEKRKRADVVLENNGTPEELFRSLRTLKERLKG